MHLRRRQVLTWLSALALIAPLTLEAQSPSRPSDASLATQLQQTESALLAAIASEPSQLGPYLELARLYKMANRPKDSIKILHQALPHHPNSTAVFAALLQYINPDSDPAGFEALIDEWRSSDPSDPHPLLVSAGLHLRRARTAVELSVRQGHVQQAAQLLDQVKAMDPARVEVRRFYLEHVKQLIPLTEDPVERQRLIDEFEAGAKVAAISGATAGVSTASPPWPAGAVRVGGNIKPPVKTKNVDAIWPPVAQQARVQGVVVLEILIEEAGKVTDAKVLRSIPLLDQAAIEAVRQWEFEPTLLNGAPVPVIMTVTVQFRLAPQFQ